MIRVEAFEPEHAMGIREAVEGPFDEEQKKEWCAARSLGPAYTIFDQDGRVLVCLGVQILWGRVGECWSVFSPEARKHPKAITEVTIKYLTRIVADFNLERLQAYARTDLKPAWKWLEVLGFEREGCLRKFGRDGSDQYIYGMVRD